MKNLKLNYSELAFIMDIKAANTKEIFLKMLDVEKVSVKDEISVLELMPYFCIIKSVDSRYDGQNELVFNLEHKSENYKKYLKTKSMAKHKKFTSGKTIFYKICNPEQLEKIKTGFDFYFNYYYPKGLK